MDRAGGRHTVYLDAAGLHLPGDLLRERYAHWPTSANPHLLVNRRGVIDPERRPITTFGLQWYFRRRGVTPVSCTHRLLDEAVHSADRVHLMRIFGICSTTATKYVKAAHPEHFVTNPAPCVAWQTETAGPGSRPAPCRGLGAGLGVKLCPGHGRVLARAEQFDGHRASVTEGTFSRSGFSVAAHHSYEDK